MRIVVTGATGFLGSWVCRILSRRHAVTALVRSESSIKRLHGIEGIRVVAAPVEFWAKEINEVNPDGFVSMEWWGVEGKDRNDPNQILNVERFKDLLSKLNPIPVMIGTGSQAELGPVSDLISESQEDAPTTEYGRCKVQVRKLFKERADEGGSRFAWARIFSTYGPLDSNEWLIPATMKALSEGREMPLTGGEQEWSYLHAYDLAKAFQAIIEHHELAGVINIGNPGTVKLRDVALKIAAIEGHQELLKFGAIPYREDQVMRLAPICESLKSIGWAPKVSLDSGLDHLHKWLIEGTNSPLFLEDGTSEIFNLPIKI